MRDDAVAYGFFMLICFIIGAGLVLALMLLPANGVTNFMNGEIDQGHVSVQTREAVQFNVGMLWWCPVFALVGLLLWVYVRPLEQKRIGQ